MKILSKVTAIVLCSVMLLSMIPFSALAASSYPNTHVNTGNMAADIVAVAVTQAGYCEGSLKQPHQTVRLLFVGINLLGLESRYVSQEHLYHPPSKHIPDSYRRPF